MNRAKMSPERWLEIKPLLESALELRTDDRRAYLDEACAGDESLRREVESFVAASEQAGAFMGRPAFEEAARMLAEELRKAPGPDEVTTVERPHGAAAPAGDRQNSQLAPGGILDGRYEIEREIGQGGIGQVFLARDRKMTSCAQVVIKVLREEILEHEDRAWFEEKFRAEIESISRINHPGVVSASDRGRLPDGRDYFVMKYVPGRTLRSVMSPHGMDPQKAADLLRKIAQPLDAAHAQGVIHRDLKPANIMLQTAGLEEHVTIIDFGVATVLGTMTASTSKQTRVVGTLPYMAPEQLQGRPAAASDVFALGVIAFEMVAGQLPFIADSTAQQIELQRAGVEENLRKMRADLPEAARSAILKAMAFEASNRYRAACEFSEAFDRALANPDQPDPFRTTPIDRVIEPPVPPWWRRRLPATVLIALLAAAVTIAGAAIPRYKLQIKSPASRKEGLYEAPAGTVLIKWGVMKEQWFRETDVGDINADLIISKSGGEIGASLRNRLGEARTTLYPGRYEVRIDAAAYRQTETITLQVTTPDQGKTIETATLAGTVIESDRKPIQGAKVTIDEMPGMTPVETSTDGVFIIKEIPIPYGEGVRININREGYLPNPYTEDVVLGKAPPQVKLRRKR
jgi:hypothetical protein